MDPIYFRIGVVVSIVALILAGVIWATIEESRRKERTRNLFAELEIRVKNAKTKEEIEKTWVILEENCVEKLKGGRQVITFHPAWKPDYIKFATILNTRHEMLLELENLKNS